MSDLLDGVKEEIRRDATIKDLTPASAIGQYDALDPSDLPAVRELIGGGANQHTNGDGETLVSDASETVRSSSVEQQLSKSVQGGRDPDFSQGEWANADFTDPEDGGVYPPELDGQAKWMGAVGKQAFAPWGDRDHPEADVDDDARWKWGLEANYASGPEVDEWVEMDPRISGRAFIQLETDPYVFVDGDDVRCPETGEVHPAFRAILEHLGPAPADISTSGAGMHAHYRGELPEVATKEPKIQLDDESWGANDAGDLPVVEIYATKHLAITHGEHVPGTPLEIGQWDTDALRSILDAAGELESPDERKRPSTDRSTYDLDEYEPTATDADETTTDIRDILTALDRLDPKRVADRTIVREWTRNRRSFLPVWGSSDDNGTANYVDNRIWHDTGHDSGYGGPVVMAAIDAGLVSHAGATPQDVCGETWFKAVDHLRDLGFSIPELDTDTGEYPSVEDADPVAILPNSPVGRVVHYGPLSADRRDAEQTPIQNRRDRTANEIATAYESYDYALVEALPTLGKTYGAVKAAAETGMPTAILTTRGRKEQYDEIASICEEFGLSYAKLPAFTHDCETANGDHGEEWANRVQGWYRSGATAKQIHKHAEDVLDRPLPCQADGRTCKYTAKWAALEAAPDTEEPVDVLIGHYTHAHKRKVTAGRAVSIDEFPGGAFEMSLDSKVEIIGAISTFLDRTPQVPFEDYTDLIEGRSDDDRRADALAYLLDDLDPDPREAFDGADGHAYAPLATFTLLVGEDLGNGWERAEFPDDDPRVGLFNRERNEIHIRTPPNLSPARSVVALDGTPTPELWELALDERLNHRTVLAEGEREEYLGEILDLNIIPTTDAVKPYAGGDYVNTQQDMALLEAISDKHGTTPGVISSYSALDVYQDEGALEFDPDDGSVSNGPADRVKWYGNVLGSNRFKHKRLGVVIGSNHYGDGFIKKWGAYAGEAVERNDEKGTDLSYGAFGDRVLTHMREHDTLQAAMRFGRDGDGATVYVHTNTLPEWVPTAGQGCVLNTWSEGCRQVLQALEDLETPTTAEISDHSVVEIDTRQVFDHLETLRERGVLERQQDDRDGRRVIWLDNGLARLNEHGDVELSEVSVEDLDETEVRELARSSSYTWEFMNLAAPGDNPAADASRKEPVTDAGRLNGGDRPPNDAD